MAALLISMIAIVWMAIAWPPSAENDTDTVDVTAPITPGDLAPERTVEIAWTSAVRLGEPLVKDGRVLVGGPEGSLLSLDLATGEELWTFDVPGEITGRPAAGSGNVFVTSAPTARLTAVTESDGSLVFSCTTGSTVAGPPTSGSGRAFVVTSDTPQIWAYDARPRSPERCKVDGIGTAIKAFGAVPVPPVMHGHTLLVVDTSGIVHAFDGNDLAGDSVWSFDVPQASGTDFETYPEVEVTQPAVLEVALASRGGSGPSRLIVVLAERRIRNSVEGWRLLGVDLHSGEATLEPITVGGPPAVGLGRIWVASTDRTGLLILDHTGNVEHTIDMPTSQLPPLVDEGEDRVYVVDSNLVVSAINGVDLTIEWRHQLETPVTRLASGMGVLLVQDERGRITALQEESESAE